MHHPFFANLPEKGAIAAHRGYRSRYPENTACAFAAALGRSHLVELDVQYSRDGHLVVLHDPDLTRTSDVRQHWPGRSTMVRDWDLDQLRCLDMGTWFLEQDPFNTIAGGAVSRHELEQLMPQRIMTLKECLRWAVRHGMPLNIELKDMTGVVEDRSIVEALLQTVGTVDRKDRLLVSSFHHGYLELLHRLDPDIALAALTDKTHPPDLPAYLAGIGAVAYHCADAIVRPELVHDLRRKGVEVGVYTVNEPTRKHLLADWGVTILFTDVLEVQAL